MPSGNPYFKLDADGFDLKSDRSCDCCDLKYKTEHSRKN